jgi:hypothetical protein
MAHARLIRKNVSVSALCEKCHNDAYNVRMPVLSQNHERLASKETVIAGRSHTRGLRQALVPPILPPTNAPNSASAVAPASMYERPSGIAPSPTAGVSREAQYGPAEVATSAPSASSAPVQQAAPSLTLAAANSGNITAVFYECCESPASRGSWDAIELWWRPVEGEKESDMTALVMLTDNSNRTNPALLGACKSPMNCEKYIALDANRQRIMLPEGIQYWTRMHSTSSNTTMEWQYQGRTYDGDSDGQLEILVCGALTAYDTSLWYEYTCNPMTACSIVAHPCCSSGNCITGDSGERFSTSSYRKPDSSPSTSNSHSVLSGRRLASLVPSPSLTAFSNSTAAEQLSVDTSSAPTGSNHVHNALNSDSPTATSPQGPVTSGSTSATSQENAGQNGPTIRGL